MLFKTSCRYLKRIEKTKKRLEMMDILQALFLKLEKEKDSEQFKKVVYLMQGKLYPDWHGKPELNMAKKLAIKAISLSTGASEKRIIGIMKKFGDLGTSIAYIKIKSKQATLLNDRNPLTISEVYDSLVQIAEYSGSDSQAKKIRLLAGLLTRSTTTEAKYIGRFIDGKMRLGMADLTIIDSVSRLKSEDDAQQKEFKHVIERAFNIYPDLGTIVSKFFSKGIDYLRKMQPQVGVPIRSMLAQRLESSEGFLEKLGNKFAAEYKLDGERVQIHKNAESITLFSRRQENITKQFPDVVQHVKDYIAPTTVILDGEIIAIDPATGEIRPFQVLMQRKRKHMISEKVAEVPAAIRVFDVMFHEQESTLDVPYLKRREILEKSILDVEKQKVILPVTQKIIDSHDELVNFYHEAIQAGTEGLICKSISKESVYQPGARGWLWIKLKSLKGGKLPDTMDLVIIGANWGEGRRSGKYGNFLVAALDKETGILKMVTRIASGMSDELADFFYKNLETTKEKPSNVMSNETPDVWIKPEIILEITGDDVTNSTQSSIGYSIRFPRILRIRKDKSIDEITTVDEIISMAINK
ncbi:MAG: ATP-dependent DNA ligase [Promethearchaeota archaeon]